MRTDAPADLKTFLTRVRRLDARALVRLRPGGPAEIRIWSALPFAVLATRTLPGEIDGDVTVGAADLFDRVTTGGLPADLTADLPRHDGQWRGVLPDATSEIVERLTAAECHRIGEAAARSLRQAQSQARDQGRAVGERRLRDALLDHVAMTVTSGDDRYEVQVRLVVGLLRMGFAPDGPVVLRRSGKRLGLEGGYGAVWATGGGLPLLT